MAYVIDGNNLIGHLPGFFLNNLESRERLISLLAKFQEIRKSRMILVFDGPPDSDLKSSGADNASFSIRYPNFDQDADETIQDIIQRSTNRKHLIVISSDRKIRQFAQSREARSMTCREFSKELKAAEKKYSQAAEADKTERPQTPLEIKHWEEIFRDKK